MAAMSYRLLRSVLNTATTGDGILSVNTCRVRGADREDPAERPIPTIDQVLALADAMPPRYRVLILVTAFTSLRGRGDRAPSC